MPNPAHYLGYQDTFFSKVRLWLWCALYTVHSVRVQYTTELKKIINMCQKYVRTELNGTTVLSLSRDWHKTLKQKYWFCFTVDQSNTIPDICSLYYVHVRNIQHYRRPLLMCPVVSIVQQQQVGCEPKSALTINKTEFLIRQKRLWIRQLINS